jgi:hypothetical protein
LTSFLQLSDWHHPAVIQIDHPILQGAYKYIEMRKNSRKGPSYLDVAEFILTGPFSPKITPAVYPAEPEVHEVPRFNNLPQCAIEFIVACKLLPASFLA